ncbi:DUF6891 domain-containing protein [Isoptericola variabilis]|uniref:DUF6891 domain-containing protein n=1 Tax=Isoptericola variabilis (strain 225) TaxID=743718 RepID=F6FPM6_ISOV2|nr:hypothetical protein [Isoptericola variabilis]AEG44758.1 hypothetical protein Isova_2022 [Isoptericola variabilis 225]TWH32371.1 hypothetical protein L600_001800000280 [Isoptericola variabilis J7]
MSTNEFSPGVAADAADVAEGSWGDEAEAVELTADDVLADVRSTARAMVRAGCCTFEQVLGRALELAALADDAPSAGSVERVVRHEWDVRAAALAQADPAASDHVRVERAFAALGREGVAARLGFSCCRECGEAELREVLPDGGAYALVTQPDLEQLAAGRLVVRCGVLRADEARAEAAVRDVVGRVVAALTEQGLDARADGRTVVVHVREWAKPLPAAA